MACVLTPRGDVARLALEEQADGTCVLTPSSATGRTRPRRAAIPSPCEISEPFQASRSPPSG
eukprot:1739775-Pyramimonas_sp.AAC.1